MSQPPLTSTPISSAAAEADLSGRQLGDFHLLHRLGRGAMADVYLAEQGRLKRRVAVKILKPELAGDRTYLQRFELEAQAAASLVHANIVQIYEVGCVDGLHYIAQEYVEGQNLREYIGRHGPPDLPHALSIMRQVASALMKAAEQGVVHRDIKPENIMLTPGGEVKVADFGLARLTGDGAASELTQVGITLGTPLYMSPEQVEGKPLDPRSDLYSFGVTCYHMLSGAPPFVGETALSVAVQHLKKQPEPLESIRGDLPPALCRIVHEMLAKDPERRFATARDLLRELRRVQMEHFGGDWPEDLPAWESIASDIAADPRVAVTRHLDGLMKTMVAARPRRRGWAWLVVGVTGALVLGGAIAYYAKPTSLLADAKPSIPPESSILRQWYRATQIGTEGAWKAVIDFPGDKDEHYRCRAQWQLALIYLADLKLDQANKIFKNLERLGNDDQDRAFGLAGQCVVLSKQRKYAESADKFAELLPMRDKVVSRDMRRLLQNALDNNRKEIRLPTGAGWDKWFAEPAPDDS